MAQKAKTTVEKVVERKRVTVNELTKFVETFQQASSIKEVARELGWKIEKVNSQATRLRKRGVELKKFPRQTSLSEMDIADLKGLCGVK